MEKMKSGEKSNKRGKIKDSAKIKIGISTIPEPTEEDIRNKASEIYNQRIERGEYGTAEKDWAEAEKYLQEEHSGNRERP